MARVMVTGARGFIGSYVTPALVAHGHDVIAITNTQHKFRSETGEQWVSCDLLSEKAVSDLMARCRPTHLVHLAWEATPGLFWNDPVNMDWLVAGLRLFRAFFHHGGRRMVGAGTCAEYDWNESFLHEADTPLRPRTLYGVTKAALGSVLQHASTAERIEFAWGRIFFLYGPGEKPGRLVSDLFAALISGRPALVSHGRQERDFMHVSDVAAAFVALLESDVTGSVNIATGRCRPLAEIIAAIAQAVGRPDLVQFGAISSPADEPLRLAAATTRLNEEVAFAPHFDLQSGIDDTYRWWQSHREKIR